MAAPTVTARSAPVGIPLKEGYRVLLGMSQDPDISVWEKTIKLPGVDMGDAIDITTQHNDEWLTMLSGALAELTEFTVVGSFDPAAYNQLIAIKGQNGAMTIHLPDGSTISFFAYVKTVEGPDAKRREQPDMTITIRPTNYDSENDVESAPVISSVDGT